MHSSILLGEPNAEALAAVHHVELGYTTADDGVWLSCACGWEHCLGWNAMPEKALELVLEHRRSEQ